MPWAVAAAAVAAGGAIYAANKSAKGAKEAAQIQAAAAGKGIDVTKEAYQDIKPYLMASLEGYQNLLEKPETYKQTPGYMFRLSEGLKAIGIPSGGRYLSGAQVKGATRYAEDYATADYQNALARIAGLGNLAQGVGATTGQFATNIANVYGQQGAAAGLGAQNAAYARASGVLGATKAISQGIGAYGASQQYSGGPATSYYGPGYSGYGGNQVPGDAYAPAYGGY